MTIRAGKLDRVITIERATTSIDPDGTPVETWAPIATVRAELLENREIERIGGYGASSDAELTFRLRWLDGITLADRVTYAGEALNIKSIVEIGRRRGLEAKCERIGHAGT